MKTFIIFFRRLQIGLTVPEMNIDGFYQINGEVFILPLEGSGTFTTKMSGVTATGASNIVPVQNPDGKQVPARLTTPRTIYRIFK